MVGFGLLLGFVWLVLVGSFFIVLINKMATIPLDK